MKKRRLIPVLLLRNGWLVQSKGFKRYKNLGNPVTAVKRLSEWASDELIYLDITKDAEYDLRRADLAHPNRNNILDIIEDVSRVTFMPITVGGGIRELQQIEKRLAVGSDKISINTIAVENPQFVKEAAEEFGSQCIVISMDVKVEEGKYCVMTRGGTHQTGFHPVIWAQQVEELGAGEILLNSIDRDGMMNGYELDLINQVVDAVKIPVIACGGVGNWSHFAEALEKTAVDAIAAANIFHHMDQSVYLAKKYLKERKHFVRPADLFSF